jgi:hypothetical protein
MTISSTKPRGQTIIEILVATVVITVAFIGIMSLGNSSIKSTSYSRNLNLATKYSYEVADWARNLRNVIGWEALAAKILADGTGSVTYCLPVLTPDATTFYNLEGGNCAATALIPSTIYTRSITFNTAFIGSKRLPATITTSWTENRQFSSKLEIELDKTQ